MRQVLKLISKAWRCSRSAWLSDRIVIAATLRCLFIMLCYVQMLLRLERRLWCTTVHLTSFSVHKYANLLFLYKKTYLIYLCISSFEQTKIMRCRDKDNDRTLTNSGQWNHRCRSWYRWRRTNIQTMIKHLENCEETFYCLRYYYSWSLKI